MGHRHTWFRDSEPLARPEPGPLEHSGSPAFPWSRWAEFDRAHEGAGDGDRRAVFVLGGFRVCVGGRRVRLSTPVRRVIAYLAICGEGMATRQAIAEALWPDRDVASARVNLRQALTQERRSSCQLVEADYETLNLHPGVSVDLHRALLAARRLLGGPAHEWADPSHFLHDILPSWDEPWLFVERERFGQLRLDCLEEIGRRWLEESQYGQAIAVAQSAVAADRLRETAQLLLIQAYLGQGNRAQAVRQYRNYAAQLEESLGLQPSEKLMALVGA